jgi:phosphonate degradation associated HDIG domain protein
MVVLMTWLHRFNIQVACADYFVDKSPDRMEKDRIAAMVDEIFDLYLAFGSSDYIGEPVSQIEHMCQAAELAQAEGHDDEVVLAAFFHDIGHLCEHVMPVELMDGLGVMDHEGVGERFLLERGFSERIARLVRSHVEAKRYLTARDIEYFQRLSDASRQTLALQGGRMSPEEADAFEQSPDFPLYIRMRQWDDMAKETGKPLPDLSIYRAMAIAHLSSNLLNN